MAVKDDTTACGIAEYEKLLAESELPSFVLRLYVVGMSPRSTEAVQLVVAMCELHLKDRYTLEVIDLYKHPELARKDQIVATPTLVRAQPEPLKRLVGTRTSFQQLISGVQFQQGFSV